MSALSHSHGPRHMGDAIDRQCQTHVPVTYGRLIPMAPDTCAGHIWPETFKAGDLAQPLWMFIVYLPPLLRLPPLGPGEGAQAHSVLAFMEGGALQPLLESMANQRTARYLFFFILMCLLSTLITLFTSNDAVEN